VSARADASTAATRREAKSRLALMTAYCEGLGLAAIAIVEDDAGPRIAVIGPPQAQAACRPPAVAVLRWWCRRVTDAERVAASAARALRRQSKDGVARPSPDAPTCTPHDLSAAIEGAARRLRIALYSDDDIAMDAGRMIARVEAEIESLKRSGQLKSVNQSYRAHRLQASARGEKAAPYADWLNQYKANLVRELAAALRYA
jgi:hypothetical protein